MHRLTVELAAFADSRETEAEVVAIWHQWVANQTLTTDH